MTQNCSFTIYKYPIDSMADIIAMPAGAKILSAIKQFNRIVVYALVDENNMEMEEFEFIRVITGGVSSGQYTLENYQFLDTLVFGNGSYIEHVFYRKIWKAVDKNE